MKQTSQSNRWHRGSRSGFGPFREY